MPSELEHVNQIFNNFGMVLSMEWLESCIEWCKNDNLPSNYSIKNLQNMVFEQWLLLDLRDVEICSLPINLSKEKKYSLTGVYYLQLVQVVDISKPKFWQLQRIRNKVAKNSESENDFGKRVLQLTLTDGVQDIEAMEFKPIACLNINLTPGLKLKIMGPIMVRNGRLMLERDNVKILGGCVEDLVVKYAAENVLARALGLEENPNPHEIDEQILDVNQANTQSHPTLNHQTINNLNQNWNQTNQHHSRNNFPIIITNNNQNIQFNNKTNVKSKEIPPEFQVDDEILRELEEDFEENSVRDFKKSMTTLPHSQRECSSPDIFEQMEFDDELLNEHLDQIATAEIANTSFSNNTTKKLGTCNTITDRTSGHIKSSPDGAISSSESNTKHKDDEVIDLDDSFDDIDIDSHLDQIDKEMASLPCSTQKIKEFKQHITSPLLKQPTSTPKLSLQKQAVSKKLTQSKLTFGTKTMPDITKTDVNLEDDDDFEDPLSIFAKSSQKRPPGFVPLDLSSIPKKSSTPLLKVPFGLSNDCKQLKCSPPTLAKVQVMPIEKLKKMIPNISKGKFKIKAKFQTVAEKLKTTETTFYLAITVSDATDDLTVEMHSDIVADFAQIKPERLTELRESVSRNDQEAKSVIFQALTNLHTKCTSLDNVLELQITRGQKYPVVINVIEESCG